MYVMLRPFDRKLNVDQLEPTSSGGTRPRTAFQRVVLADGRRWVEVVPTRLRARGVDVEEPIMRPGDPIVCSAGAAQAGYRRCFCCAIPTATRS